MGALVGRFTGDGRKAGTMRDAFTGPESPIGGGKPTPSGVVIGGAAYQLPGQPPVARSHGWGNMSWLAFRR
jgi:hypothetical protein